MLVTFLCNKKDHRGIKTIVEVKGCHVSLIPLSTLGISGRDSCKGGRFVTAQIWYPKIWVKFPPQVFKKGLPNIIGQVLLAAERDRAREQAVDCPCCKKLKST